MEQCLYSLAALFLSLRLTELCEVLFLSACILTFRRRRRGRCQSVKCKMKTAVKTIFVVLLVSVVSFAQTPKKKYDWHFVESSAIFWSGVSTDWISGRGVSEQNPFIRNSRGRLDNKKFWSFNALGYAGSCIIQKKWPRLANWIRRGAGVIHFSAAAYNLPRRGQFPNEAE
jgi:hypothetical protein